MKQTPSRKRLRLVLKSLVFKRLFWASLVWLGFGFAAAQTPLAAYTQAKTALGASIAATPNDPVASLDALRRAKQAFAPLGESLGGPLNQGLQATFDTAERAIINASATDLKVQAAVLFGGFQRSLYEAALNDAQDGDAAAASRLLGVLGRDLGLNPAQFSSTLTGADAARDLQLTFERRLATRSLEQLEALRALPETRATRDARYEALGRLYSHVFLIQDSPRLPDAAQNTVLGAIQALIERRTLEPTLRTLQTQLQTFQKASTAAQQRLSPAPASQVTPAEPATSPNQTEGKAADSGAEDTAGDTVAGGAETTRTPATEATASETPATSAQEPADAEGTAGEADTEPTTSTTPAAAEEASVPPVTSAPAATPSQPESTLFGLLTPMVRTYLLIAAGLLAFVGIVLLLAGAGASPALNLATVLLLLPVLAEGLIALGARLAPLVGMPELAQGEAYSLFVNPLVQALWTLLAIGAGLFLLFTRRRATPAQAEPGAFTEASAQTSPQPTPKQQAPAQLTSGQPTPVQRAPLSSAGSFNWDEDF